MNIASAWLAALVTVALLLAYEAALLLVQRRSPAQLARSAHGACERNIRGFIRTARIGNPGLANASQLVDVGNHDRLTAVLGPIRTVTLAAPSLSASMGKANAIYSHLTARQALELVLMGTLFASLACSAMAVRYYNHAGFITSLPVGSQARQRWAVIGSVYLRRAGLRFSWGLRHLVIVAPVLASIIYPWAGPVSTVAVVLVLTGFDRFSPFESARRIPPEDSHRPCNRPPAKC